MTRVKMSKACEQCGEIYPRNPKFGKSRWESSRFCGRKCTGLAKAASLAADRPSLREKFESLFTRADGCWVWEGTIDGYGYGVIDHAGRRYRAHVLALEFDGRPVKSGMLACHHCDNPPCVNPTHLYPGTQKTNSDDAISRGRNSFGARNFNAKLTDSDVVEIRKISGVTFTAIAELYGVSRPTVARVISGKHWRHVR